MKNQSRILLSNGKNSKFEEESQATVDGAQKLENRSEKSTDSSGNTTKESKNNKNQPVTASVKNIVLSYNEALFFLQGQILQEGDDSDILLESLPDSLLLSILENLEQGSPSTGEVKNMEILSVKKEKTAYRILLKFTSEVFPEEQYRSCLVAENAGEQGLTFTVQSMAEASAEEKSKMESLARALQEEVAEQAGEGTESNGDGQAVEAAPQAEAVPAETEAAATTATTEAVNNASANKGTWKEQFYEFVKNERYRGDVDIFDRTSAIIALYDITNDGVPELLVGNQNGSSVSYTCFYRATEKGVQKIEGAMDVYSPSAYAGYSKDRKYPGLFGGLWFRGNAADYETGLNRMYYYYYDGSKIDSTEIATYTYTDDDVRHDEPVTSDAALYAAYLDKGYIEYIPAPDALKMGWDNFVKKYPY